MSETIKVHVVSRRDRKHLTMRYVCPVTGRAFSRSAGTHLKKEAAKVAAVWEAELREGRYQRAANLGWDEFVDRWQDAKAPNLKASTLQMHHTTFSAFERHMRPKRLADLTTARVDAFAAALRAEGLSEASVSRHLEKMRAVANWAVSRELLAKLPSFDMPSKASAKMKGRPITGEEFDRMLAAVPQVVIEHLDPNASEAEIDRDPRVVSWRLLLWGLWWSGLRLGEAVALRWDQTPGGVWCVLDGKKSVLAFDTGSQKSNKAELVPLAWQAVELLEPMREDRGYVFSPQRLRGSGTMQRTRHKVGLVISKIGAAARVVVNVETGKTASAHDLRRSFGFRWAQKVMPAVLMRLMRHQDISTTMNFYVGHNAMATAAEVWKTRPGGTGATLGASRLDNAPATP